MEWSKLDKLNEKKNLKGGAEKLRENRCHETEATKYFKITNYLFSAITCQSSQPGEPEGITEERKQRESSPVIPATTVQLLFNVLQLKR